MYAVVWAKVNFYIVKYERGERISAFKFNLETVNFYDFRFGLLKISLFLYFRFLCRRMYLREYTYSIEFKYRSFITKERPKSNKKIITSEKLDNNYFALMIAGVKRVGVRIGGEACTDMSISYILVVIKNIFIEIKRKEKERMKNKTKNFYCSNFI